MADVYRRFRSLGLILKLCGTLPISNLNRSIDEATPSSYIFDLFIQIVLQTVFLYLDFLFYIRDFCGIRLYLKSLRIILNVSAILWVYFKTNDIVLLLKKTEETEIKIVSFKNATKNYIPKINVAVVCYLLVFSVFMVRTIYIVGQRLNTLGIIVCGCIEVARNVTSVSYFILILFFSTEIRWMLQSVKSNIYLSIDDDQQYEKLIIIYGCLIQTADLFNKCFSFIVIFACFKIAVIQSIAVIIAMTEDTGIISMTQYLTTAWFVINFVMIFQQSYLISKCVSEIHKNKNFILNNLFFCKILFK